MDLVGDVKCYHCGHVSGQVEGTRKDRLVLHSFRPREGFKGEVPKAGQRLRCERCEGPVFLEDLRPLSMSPIPLPMTKPRRGRPPSRTKAA